MDMKIDIRHKKTMVRYCIIATFNEHELDNQIEEQARFSKKIYTIRAKLKVTTRDLTEKSKIAVKYLNDFENNNKNDSIKSVMTNISNSLSQSVQLIFFFSAKKECS